MVHPVTGHGSAGRGHDVVTGAAVLDALLALVVVDLSPTLAIVPVLPETWIGQNFEIDGMPTRSATLSFAVRWHGRRPAILWELTPNGRPDGPSEPIRLVAPGLDTGWSTTELQGDTLLGEVAMATEDESDTDSPPPADTGSPAPSISTDDPSAPGGDFS